VERNCCSQLSVNRIAAAKFSFDRIAAANFQSTIANFQSTTANFQSNRAGILHIGNLNFEKVANKNAEDGAKLLDESIATMKVGEPWLNPNP
jgi:hypothetical protein